jgi:hypothetical protein
MNQLTARWPFTLGLALTFLLVGSYESFLIMLVFVGWQLNTKRKTPDNVPRP